MKVKARYFAHVREIVGKSEETFDVPSGTTAQAFLTMLSQKYGEAFRDYVFSKESDEPSPNVNFLLNGKNVNTMKGTETILYEGSSFAILPPVGGG